MIAFCDLGPTASFAQVGRKGWRERIKQSDGLCLFSYMLLPPANKHSRLCSIQEKKKKERGAPEQTMENETVVQDVTIYSGD